MALSQREKRLLVLPVVIGAVLGFYNYVHEPLFARRAEAADKGQQVAAQLQKDEEKLVREGNLAVRKEAVAAREKVIDTWVPGKNSAALLIWYLSQAEKETGTRIKSVTLSDRKQISASQASLANAAQTSGGQPAQGAKPATPQSNPPAAPAAADASVMLTVIELDLQVEGIFTQHQHLSQVLGQMPLFLDTKALMLNPIHSTQASPDMLGSLLKGGNRDLAAQLAALSPRLTGSYQISLYFKGEKIGPETSTMTFAEGTGRIDPFARAGIDEFLQTLTEYYSLQPRPDGSRGPLPPLPEDLKGQLG
ncbi:MAG TPA: hypothetical protein VD969_15485 [Symbiobacteriaceae bacterium]|nr:hypothetical protein [Symbiobacteriaceae bacterium]